MSIRPHTLTLPVALALSGALAAQSQTVIFQDASGLSAEAEFTLMSGGTQLEIRLKNTSTGVPAGFSSADQLITGVSFDLGLAGQDAGDPAITGGTAKTGPTSMSVNFDVQNVGSDADVGGEWGYGNGGGTGIKPNFISGNTSGTTPFGGPNLDGPDNLNGPQAGLIPAVPVVDLGGLGAIQDEIVALLDLDQALSDLDFLEQNGTTLEFGSDAAFLDGCPDCDENAAVVKVDDPNGLNLSGGLCATPGSLPTIGNPEWCLDVDDANNMCGLNAGANTYVVLSPGLANFQIPGFGCAPGANGTVLIDLPSAGMFSGPIAWGGPGVPATHCFAIPDDVALCGLTCYGQAVIVDRRAATKPGVLTNRVDVTIGN